MKTAILQLENHDDRISINDKISWCKSERIIIVYPPNIRRVPGVLDLRLMKRSAKIHGARIALVTRDRWIIENADMLGIPVFSSVPKAEKANWDKENDVSIEGKVRQGVEAINEKRDLAGKRSQSMKLNPILRLVVFLFTLFSLLVLAVFIIPSAKIVVYPETIPQSIVLDVTATTSVNQISITGFVPATKQIFSLRLSKTATSSGTVGLPQTKASGFVTIRNVTSNTLILPAGVVFSTDDEQPIRFISKEQVEISTGNMEINIPVEALLSGEEGNISAGRISKVEGIYQSMLEVSNPEEFSQGKTLFVPSPTDEDYQILRNDIINQLFKQARLQVEAGQTGEKMAIIESLETVDIVSEVATPAAGEPSDSLTIEMEIQYSVLEYDVQDVVELSNLVLESSKGGEVHNAGKSLKVERIGETIPLAEGSFRWKITAERFVVQDWDQDSTKKLILGKSINDALPILNSQISTQKKAEINPFPFFWDRLPFLASQINIEEHTVQ